MNNRTLTLLLNMESASDGKYSTTNSDLLVLACASKWWLPYITFPFESFHVKHEIKRPIK